jgi:hypothetical protein
MFNQLAAAEPGIPRDLTMFLERGYEMKVDVDYDTDP